MSDRDLGQALPGQQTDDEDAQLDALLAAADAAVLGRLAKAVDIDAGRAAVFAPSINAEEVPSSDEADASELEWLLPFGEDSLLQWLAISGPGYLPRQLDKSTSTIRTMTVVGRALLPHSVRTYWGLATDFLTTSSDHLMRLKTGLAHHELTREAALAVHHAAQMCLGQFLGTLHQAAQAPNDPQTSRVIERLVSTGEMVLTLLDWARQSIEELFADTDRSLRCPAG
ncbi:hypothetical protein PH213_31345 [Streptomyces sp. SRF1]|uniref:hypothetical protein n=1 Tax=Streptomyces sp. SRF1 TaxID=1549642 RepID=UPI0025B2184A|nr:hypothetical protein [Streptomyces sp. SRF1]MDN3058957.1 hypothetical protein [Streptomyces sp. SRF1]